MGIRGTDDYLTARAANPRTGLVSPSVVTNLTPRTPMSPAEALALYGESHTYSPSLSSRPSSPDKHSTSADRPRPSGPRGRWRQDSTGWNIETLSDTESPRLNTANSSAIRADFNASEDTFVVPMPSAKDPQPYRQEDQDKAVQYYRDKAQRLSQKEGMNGRMHSIGAGPRKFAQATRALRDFSSPSSSPPQEADTSSQTHKAVASSPPTAKFPSFSPTIAASTPTSPKVSRKAVQSPAPEYERRDSAISMGTSTSMNDTKNPHEHSSAVGGAHRARSNSNTSRFQDLRQLPRVRVVHPEDSSTKKAHSSSKRGLGLRDDTSSPPPPYPSDRIHGTPSLSSTLVTESLSPLETQVVGFLAWAINQLFSKEPKTSDDASGPSTIGIVKAIHILSDAKTEPIQRWQAIKALALTALRVIMVLGFIAIVVRIGTAVGRVLAVVLWPVGVVWMIVRWLLGLG